MAEDIQALLDKGLVEDAVDRLRKQQPPFPQENVWALVKSQLARRRFDRASRVMETIPHDAIYQPAVSEFITMALNEGQYQLAVKWSMSRTPELRPNIYDCVGWAIRKEQYEVALKYIGENNLQGVDVKMLLNQLCKQGNFAQVRKFAQQFQLDQDFPPEHIFDLMMQAGQWEVALNLRSQVPKLKESVSGLAFLERIIASRDWVSALKYSEQFGIPPQSKTPEQLTVEKRLVVRMMIDGMVRDGKLFQAMMLTMLHFFQDEFPPKVLIRTMIRERQYAHALRFMKELDLESEFTQDIARIQKERLRDLTEFRRLMDKRRLEARHRLARPQEPLVVVANIFLGARMIRRRADGKMVAVSTLNDTHTLLDGVSTVRDEGTDEDDDEEIIMNKQPNAQRSHLNGPATYAPRGLIPLPISTGLYPNGNQMEPLGHPMYSRGAPLNVNPGQSYGPMLGMRGPVPFMPPVHGVMTPSPPPPPAVISQQQQFMLQMQRGPGMMPPSNMAPVVAVERRPAKIAAKKQEVVSSSNKASDEPVPKTGSKKVIRPSQLL